MHIFINALSATAGGGHTYVRNLLPQLSAEGRVKVTVLAGDELVKSLGRFRNVSCVSEAGFDGGAAKRYWQEQNFLPRMLRQHAADLLISAGNFALFNSPVPQILLTRNSLYASPDFYADLLRRRAYGLWMDTRFKAWFAKRSVRWADCTVAPSEAFAQEVRKWCAKGGARVKAIPHGFSPQLFFAADDALPGELAERLGRADAELRLLFVSHYNYFRNFDTLIKALPILRRRLPERRIKLLVTCDLHSKEGAGGYDPAETSKLVEELGVAESVVELGPVPYHHLHKVYRSADIYITPSYTETFAHPLVEAMASGLPVVASDLPVHREVCGDAASYFPRFSPEDLARCVERVARSKSLAAEMRELGYARSERFSWARHAEALLGLAGELCGGRKSC